MEQSIHERSAAYDRSSQGDSHAAESIPQATAEEVREIKKEARQFDRQRKTLFTRLKDIPEADWIVEGIAAREGITLLYGEGGIGKTSLMLQLIGCINEGKPFLGLRADKANILLIEQDENPSLLRSHVGRMIDTHPSLDDLVVPNPWVYWDNKGLMLKADGLSLNDLIGYADLPDVVIIDSFTSLGVEDVNHPKSSLVFDSLRQVAKDVGSAFVVLHHPNKDGGFMGSNLMRAKVDCMLHMVEVLGGVSLKFEKLRSTSPEVATLGNPPYLTLRQDSHLVFHIALGVRAAVKIKMRQGKTKAQIVDEIADEWEEGSIASDATSAASVKRMARRICDELAREGTAA